jgi:hypothetical protein
MHRSRRRGGRCSLRRACWRSRRATLRDFCARDGHGGWWGLCSPNTFPRRRCSSVRRAARGVRTKRWRAGDTRGGGHLRWPEDIVKRTCCGASAWSAEGSRPWGCSGGLQTSKGEVRLRFSRFRGIALFAWLISHQATVLLSHNKPATSNQCSSLRRDQHQPTEQAQSGYWFCSLTLAAACPPAISDYNGCFSCRDF